MPSFHEFLIHEYYPLLCESLSETRVIKRDGHECVIADISLLVRLPVREEEREGKIDREREVRFLVVVLT